MWAYEGIFCGFGWWWVIPIAMIVMMALCFFMMRRHAGCAMCGPPFVTGDRLGRSSPESARQILDKRYARGEIGKEEYEQKKKDIE
jgi:putative membrane protein